jgi:ABC-type polysaccharide/polyol phosphate export permease
MPSRAELLIDGGPKPRLLQALGELWAFRGTVLAFAERDVRVKYKQAVLGVAWAVLQPLVLMAVFSFALGRLAGMSAGETPYPAFALSALVPWMFLQTGVSFGASTLLADASLLRKIYFPREVPILGAILGAGVDFAVGLGVFALLGPFLGARPSPAWLLAPLLGVVLALLGAGTACLFAALNVYYRDFRYALPFALQVWLFASPVAYPLSAVPERWRGIYVVLNPAAGILDCFREVLALGRLPGAGLLLVSSGGALVVAWLGYRVFKNLEPNFADVV